MRSCGPRALGVAVLHLAAWHDLEVLQLCLRVAAAVRLDVPDDQIEPTGAERMCLLQHLVGFPNARCGADIDAQPRAVLLLDAGEQRVGGRTMVGR